MAGISIDVLIVAEALRLAVDARNPVPNMVRIGGGREDQLLEDMLRVVKLVKQHNLSDGRIVLTESEFHLIERYLPTR